MLVWFRQDLRLADNPALTAAARLGGPVVPVFIWSPEEEGDWPPGAASKWWLHHSLARLAAALAGKGSRLIIRRGHSLGELIRLARETGATRIYWNRRYEPALLRRDATIKASLETTGWDIKAFSSALLCEPGTVHNQSQQPYRIFTPFWKACLALENWPKPIPPPRSLRRLKTWPRSDSVASLELEPRLNWASGFSRIWAPGEAGAKKRLDRFLVEKLMDYDRDRDGPALTGTSRLSPHLHFGEISPRQIWQAVWNWAHSAGVAPSIWKHGQFLAEIGWREFAHHLLYHFPKTPLQPLRPEFEGFPWRENKEGWQAWRQGETGYPMVDAGLRELWATGWMHNRARMITSSFLVKDLLLPWQDGARWFWDTLVDADLANNSLGWQWSAGCGADAAPYFRIFNPVRQGEQLDPDGLYVRRWIPALARVPAAWIHKPWQAPEGVLRKAGLKLDRHYPRPIVRHVIARELALEAYERMKSAQKI
jgi:deoxyribodipyrimidine photo-lyase